MDREAVRQKIKRLLALTESDNENEALAAAQAARKLMMKYHISVEEDGRNDGIERGVVTKELRVSGRITELQMERLFPVGR